MVIAPMLWFCAVGRLDIWVDAAYLKPSKKKPRRVAGFLESAEPRGS